MLFLVLRVVTLYLIGEPGREQTHFRAGIKPTEISNKAAYIAVFETHALPMICDWGQRMNSTKGVLLFTVSTGLSAEDGKSLGEVGKEK